MRSYLNKLSHINYVSNNSLSSQIVHCLRSINKLLIIVIVIHFAIFMLHNDFTEALITELVSKDDIYFEILEPETLRYTFRCRLALNFGTNFKVEYSHINLVIVEPNDACSTAANRFELKNNIGFIQRGGCSFLEKCIEAEHNGMVAIIIYDNNNNNDDLYIEMVGDNTSRNCSIPAAFLLGKDGHMIRRALDAHNLNRAVINIPINISLVPNKKRQPPWVVW